MAISRFAASRAVTAAALVPRPPLDLSPLSASCRSYWITVPTDMPREPAIVSTSCPGVAIFDSSCDLCSTQMALCKAPFAFYANAVMLGRFIAYYRVLTDRQGRSGLGLEAQQRAVQAYLNGGEWS